MSWLEELINSQEQLEAIHKKYQGNGYRYTREVLDLMFSYQYSPADMVELMEMTIKEVKDGSVIS